MFDLVVFMFVSDVIYFIGCESMGRVFFLLIWMIVLKLVMVFVDFFLYFKLIIIIIKLKLRVLFEI